MSPVSPALPRSQLLHRDGATTRPVQWYFDNLLPEEHLRVRIATEANIAGNSGEDHEPDLHKPTVQLSGRFEQRLR